MRGVLLGSNTRLGQNVCEIQIILWVDAEQFGIDFLDGAIENNFVTSRLGLNLPREFLDAITRNRGLKCLDLSLY
jgi:hypothetical protein